jgi:hypothetical protein
MNKESIESAPTPPTIVIPPYSTSPIRSRIQHMEEGPSKRIQPLEEMEAPSKRVQPLEEMEQSEQVDTSIYSEETPDVPFLEVIMERKGGNIEYKDIEAYLNSQYNSKNTNKSVICDIIAMYIKGQKILYTEAKTICEQRMNYLMLPAIFVTSLCAILSLVLKDYGFGPTLVSSLNGVNAFLLALISYLKLDAKAEGHRTAAYKFDKLQSQLEFQSGKSMFMEVSYKDLVKFINDIEANVKDIKETNKFILPEDIRVQYPKLCNLNVFAEVKKIHILEMQKIKEVVDKLNELATAEEHRKPALEMEHQKLVHEFIGMKDDFLHIDDAFTEEMEKHRKKLKRSCQPCGWLKT